MIVYFIIYASSYSVALPFKYNLNASVMYSMCTNNNFNCRSVNYHIL